MQAWRLINAVVNNAVTLQLTHQTAAGLNHSHPARFVVDSLSQIL